ncbi:hypothetical protein D3C87_1789990 [compost metagenome]
MGHDVAELSVAHDVEVNLRVLAQKARQHRLQHQADRAFAGIDPQGAARDAAEAVDLLQGAGH